MRPTDPTKHLIEIIETGKTVDTCLIAYWFKRQHWKHPEDTKSIPQVLPYTLSRSFCPKCSNHLFHQILDHGILKCGICEIVFTDYHDYRKNL
jgi:hypothetical protein